MAVTGQDIEEFRSAAEIAAGLAGIHPEAFNSPEQLAELTEDILETKTGAVKIGGVGTLHISSDKSKAQIRTPGGDIQSLR